MPDNVLEGVAESAPAPFVIHEDDFSQDEWALLVSEAQTSRAQGRGYMVRAAACIPGCGAGRAVRVGVSHVVPGVSEVRLRCLSCDARHELTITTPELN